MAKQILNRIQRRNQKRLNKLHQALFAKGRMSNRELRCIVRVSSATMTRYMDELEEQGKVKQIYSKEHAKYQAVRISNPVAQADASSAAQSGK